MHKYNTLFFNVLFIFFVFNINSWSQIITPTWTKFHVDKAYGSRLVVTSYANDAEGNTYITGYAANEPTDYDIILLGLNSNGDTILNREYDNHLFAGSRNIGKKIHLDASGHLVVVGSTDSNGSGYGDALIQKYNITGELLWSFIHQPKDESFSEIIQSKCGANDTIYLITIYSGNDYYFETLSPDGQLIRSIPLSRENSETHFYIDTSSEYLYSYQSKNISKFDFDGNEIWKYSDLFKHKIDLTGILIDSKNDCYLYGKSFDDITYRNNYHILKLSSAGSVIWEKKVISNAYNSYCQDAIFDSQEGVSIAYQNNTQTSMGDIHILNIDPTGTQTREFDISLPPEKGRWKVFKGMCYDANGNFYYVALNSSDYPNYASSIKKLELGKYNSRGELQWQKELELTPGMNLTGPFIISSDTENTVKLTYNKAYSRNPDLKYVTDEESTFLALSGTGEMEVKANLKSAGFSKISAYSISHGPDGNYTLICESDLCHAGKKIVAIQFDPAGNKKWEYNYQHPNANKWSLKIAKVYTLSNGATKILIGAQGYEESGFEDKHIILTIDKDGKEEKQTELDIASYPFAASNSNNNHYYLQYWQENVHFLACFNADDNIKWKKTLSDNSFIENAAIQSVDKDDNLFVYASGNLSKIDTTGNILWTTHVGDVDHINSNVVFNKNNDVFLYRNEKVMYNYKKLGLYKISKEGDLLWGMQDEILTGKFIVWPRPDGGVSVFGKLNESNYGNGYDLTAMLSINKDGVQDDRTDFAIYSYNNTSSAGNDRLYISTHHGILLFDKDGRYRANLTFKDLSFGHSPPYTKDITFDEDSNAVAVNEISVSGYSNPQMWTMIATSKFDTRNMVSQENSAPIFIHPEETLNNTIYFENYPNKATDQEGDPILYSLQSDDSNRYFINPRIGNIQDRYTSSPPKRGIHTLVIRASDPHGAYTEKKLTLVIGPDNEPFFISSPKTYCRTGSAYTYQALVADPDKDLLKFSLINNSADWLTIDENTGQLSGTPPPNAQNTSVNVTIEAHEETFGHKTRQSFDLFIDKQNTPPIIMGISTVATLNQPYNHKLTYNDADNDTCTWKVQIISDWLKFDSKSNTIYGTPTRENLYTTSLLTVQVTDEFLATTGTTFQIEIEHPNNQPPIIASQSIVQAYTNLDYYYVLDTFDPEGDPFYYETIELPPFLTLRKGGRLIGRPTRMNEGHQYPVKIKVTDYFGLESTQEFVITVSPEAKKPEELPFNLQLTFNTDKTELEINLSNLPSSSVEIEVMDRTGKTLSRLRDLEVSQGKVNKIIDASSWHTTDFIISVLTDNKRFTKKISNQPSSL